MNKLLNLILILFMMGSCNNLNKLETDSFIKEEWMTSSEYRYTIAKSASFPDLKGKSKEDVKIILGEPDEVKGEIFIYCFDLNSVKYYDQNLKRTKCDCKGSFVTIDFKVDERWRTTFSWISQSYCDRLARSMIILKVSYF